MSDLSKAYEKLCQSLPQIPTQDEPFWSNGWLILANSAEKANEMADYLDETFGAVSVTGYYDPEEDERNGDVDMMTGYWYVDI